MTVDAFDTSFNGGFTDAHETKLDRTGSALIYSTYLGGNTPGFPQLWAGEDTAWNVHVTPANSTIVTGHTYSSNFPTTAGAYNTQYTFINGELTENIFVTKFSLPELPYGLSRYGAGLPGCTGEHRIGGNTSPKVNTLNFTLLCDHAPSGSLGLAIVGNAPLLTGVDLFNIGVPILVDLLNSAEVFLFDTVSNAFGTGQAPAAIPNDPLLGGLKYYAQVLWYWSGWCAPSPLGLSASQGLEICIIP